jgi:hypothetical protein
MVQTCNKKCSNQCSLLWYCSVVLDTRHHLAGWTLQKLGTLMIALQAHCGGTRTPPGFGVRLLAAVSIICASVHSHKNYNARYAQPKHYTYLFCSTTKKLIALSDMFYSSPIWYTIFFISFLTTLALHVSGAICTHHQENSCRSVTDSDQV